MESSQKARNVFKEKIILQRLENRDSIILEYLQNPPSDKKQKFCRFFLQGCCIFTEKDCHYAHGVNDLLFKGLDLSEYVKKIEDNCLSDSSLRT